MSLVSTDTVRFFGGVEVVGPDGKPGLASKPLDLVLGLLFPVGMAPSLIQPLSAAPAPAPACTEEFRLRAFFLWEPGPFRGDVAEPEGVRGVEGADMLEVLTYDAESEDACRAYVLAASSSPELSSSRPVLFVFLSVRVVQRLVEVIDPLSSEATLLPLPLRKNAAMLPKKVGFRIPSLRFVGERSPLLWDSTLLEAAGAVGNRT